MNLTSVFTAIDAAIKSNGTGQITGDVLNGILKDAFTAMNSGKTDVGHIHTGADISDLSSSVTTIMATPLADFGTLQSTVAPLPAAVSNKDRVYSAGALKSDVITCLTTGTVSTGMATFYLTDNGLAGGNAIFPNEVFKTSARLWVDDASLGFYFGNYTLSGDRKTLTVAVKTPGNASITAITVLIPAVVNAVNGTVVNLVIRGR